MSYQIVSERASEFELSSREQEVLLLLADGLSTGEIAGRLSVAEVTVRTHVANLESKLGVSGRAQLMTHAIESGVLVREGSEPPGRMTH